MNKKYHKLGIILHIIPILFLVLGIFLINPIKTKALSWTKVLDIVLDIAEESSNTDGFYSFKEFNNQLYAGGLSGVEGESAELWTTSDGENWSRVNSYTSAYEGIPTMEVMGDYLYVVGMPLSFTFGTEVTQYLEIKRSIDGENWQTVVDNSTFGDENLKAIWALKNFNNYLYVSVLSYDSGTRTSNGFEIWRSSDGTTWEQVASGGLGDANNLWSVIFEEFNNELYLGTFNFNLDIATATGTEIWRSASGDSGSWEQVNADGFGDPDNFVTYMMVPYKGNLYSAVWNWSELEEDEIQFWQSATGQDWSSVSLSGLDPGSGGSFLWPMIVNDVFWMGNSYDSGGAGLFYSTDVSNWTQEGAKGFGDANNEGLYAMTLFNNYLYISFYNDFGAQVWRSGPIDPLTILTETLPTATVGSNYSATLEINSGTTPYSCAYTGDLPPGLSLSSSCVISGTPTHASDHSFIVYAVDSGIPVQDTSRSFIMTVNEASVTTELPETGTKDYHYSWFLIGGTLCLLIIYPLLINKLKSKKVN